jgi:hypothetical protein
MIFLFALQRDINNDVGNLGATLAERQNGEKKGTRLAFLFS